MRYALLGEQAAQDALRWIAGSVKSKPGAAVLLGMLVIFSVSLLLRTVDPLVCPVLPVGTHFAWHLLNAVVLYRAMRLLID